MASALKALSKSIESIDEQIISLLAERRTIAIKQAKEKMQQQKPLRYSKSEKKLLEHLIKKGSEKKLDQEYITKLFQNIMEDCILHQQSYLQNSIQYVQQYAKLNVAFLGGKGSYSHLATRHFFARRQVKLCEVHCSSFKEILEQVEKGQAEYGVLPIENTSSGSINEVYDLLQRTHLSIVGEITKPIQHELLVACDTKLSKLTTLYSHPQPHQQCSEFLRTLPKLRIEFCSSTAEAMKKVAKLNSVEVAAIANAESGKLYGLSSIQQNIANQIENETRFIIVARKAVEVALPVLAKTTFIMSTGQQVGALVDCLLVLKKHKIAMTKLESRPVIGDPWQEMFYVDVEANLAMSSMKKALQELTRLTRYLKVLGCYSIENVKHLGKE